MKRTIVSVFVAVIATISLSTAAMADSLFKQGDLAGGIGWDTNDKGDNFMYGKGRVFFTDNICGTFSMAIHHPASVTGTQYKYTTFGLEYHQPLFANFDGYISAGLGTAEFRIMNATGTTFTEAHGNGGLTYGAGVEYMFIPNWFFNIDATVNSYSTTNAAFLPAATIGPNTTISASVNWDFMNVMPLFKK